MLIGWRSVSKAASRLNVDLVLTDDRGYPRRVDRVRDRVYERWMWPACVTPGLRPAACDGDARAA
jgi:hypothetical protein